MTPTDIGAAAVWGFLVGFVGWASCFRLIGPWADWLVPSRPESPVRGIVRLLVAIFLIVGNLLALALMPMLLTVAGQQAAGDRTATWRTVFGVTFMFSLAGLLVNGLMGRFGGGTDLE